MEAELESLVKFLVDRGILDNESDETQTVNDFLKLFEVYERDDVLRSDLNRLKQDAETSQEILVEAPAVFALADLTRNLSSQ